MTVNIMFFGQLAELTGTNSLTKQNAGDTDTLIASLKNDFPKLANTTFRLAVDKKIITENVKLQDGTTVALLPPFSGG